jgi:hypothetical protein
VPALIGRPTHISNWPGSVSRQQSGLANILWQHFTPGQKVTCSRYEQWDGRNSA